MDIIEALKNKDEGLRVSNGFRWLVSDDNGQWIVYERMPYKKKTMKVIETEDEELAVKMLLGNIEASRSVLNTKIARISKESHELLSKLAIKNESSIADELDKKLGVERKVEGDASNR
jgi:hypothetical protein